MPYEDEYFDEEEGMVRMTFGEHLEELRRRLLLALFGFLPGLIIGLGMGKPVMRMLAMPVERELAYYDQRRLSEFERQYEARLRQNLPIRKDRLILAVPLNSLRQVLAQLGAAAPNETRQAAGVHAAQANRPPEPEHAHQEAAHEAAKPEARSERQKQLVRLEAYVDHDALVIATWEPLLRRLGLRSLSAQEAFMAWMKVSIMVGLIISSPWVIYQLWAFVAEGLYRHERRIVYRAAPFGIGLFLLGVSFCFVVVLPVVVRFFFGFNRWLNIEPDIRLNEWLSFAVVLPIIFGICFELPLMMLVLEIIGVFGIEDYMSKWRHAVLAIAVLAMVVTPTTDPGTMLLLMTPMTGLYWFGIFLVRWRMARRGEVELFTQRGKVIGLIVAAAVIYCIVLVAGCRFSGWWFENIWWYGSWPVSAVVTKRLAVTPQDSGWIWATTAANAALLSLLAYRIAELFLPRPQRAEAR